MQDLLCYGYRFQLEASPALQDALLSRGFSLVPRVSDSQYLATFETKQSGQFFDLYQGKHRLVQSQSLALVTEVLVGRINSFVSHHRHEFTFIQADVVQVSEAEAVVISGPAFSGKTYLSQAILGVGAKLWSSRFAVLNDQGAVFQYPSAEMPQSGLRLKAQLQLRYSPGGDWRVQSVSGGQAALQLMPLVAANEDHLAKALPRLAAAGLACSLRLQGQRGDVAESIPALERLGLFDLIGECASQSST